MSDESPDPLRRKPTDIYTTRNRHSVDMELAKSYIERNIEEGRMTEEEAKKNPTFKKILEYDD